MQFTIETEQDRETPEEEILALTARSMGGNWTTKSSHQLRIGREPIKDLSLVAFKDDVLVGTVRLWSITAGTGGDALLLGPLAIEPELQGLGLGQRMLKDVISRAKAAKYGAIILVGDALYYERSGFSSKPTWHLRMPGRYDQNRLLGYELVEGYLDGAEGVITR